MNDSGLVGFCSPIHPALRHAFGKRAGHMDALVLRDLMGHKSLRTTQQYAQVNGEAVKKAFRAFDRGWSRK